MPAFDRQRDAGCVGGRFLSPGEGQEFAQRRPLARHHDAHAGIARAGGDRRGPEHQRQDADPGGCFWPGLRIESPAMTWPSSCATTPCSWFTLSAASSRP